jgi:hypothetical protein
MAPQQSKGSSSFLKKRTKKLFFTMDWSCSVYGGFQDSFGAKVFWFFFSKKYYFLPESTGRFKQPQKTPWPCSTTLGILPL